MADITTVGGYEKPIGGEKYSRAMVNRNLDRNERDLVEQKKNPKGLVAYAQNTTNSGAIGAKTVILNIPSFTFKANRRYRVELDGNYACSGTASTMQLTLNTAPVADAAGLTTNLTGIRSTADRPNMANEGRRMNVMRPGLSYGADTTLQIKACLERVNGSDGFFTSTDASNPITLTIHDEGDNAVVY